LSSLLSSVTRESKPGEAIKERKELRLPLGDRREIELRDQEEEVKEERESRGEDESEKIEVESYVYKQVDEETSHDMSLVPLQGVREHVRFSTVSNIISN